ncbi:unnamed protein product [Trifolium pratense]|uniref:Uncharacterized protein n=1 Tax=Trifolium pratense TaxID=57577 RepID=A0ACB0JKU7_TRIPR|nr:unnamed protein product [Trifolium pratense]
MEDNWNENTIRMPHRFKSGFREDSSMAWVLSKLISRASYHLMIPNGGTITSWSAEKNLVDEIFILNHKKALQDGYQYRIGDGNSSLWYSPWLLNEPLCRKVNYVAIQDSHLRVRDIFINDGWNLNILYTILPPDIIDLVINNHLTLDNGTTDCFIWNHGLNGVYSVASGYNWLRQQRGSAHNNASWSWIWKLAAPEKIKFFIWCVCHHVIPTLSLLCRRNLAPYDIFPRCSISEETILHCMRDCNTAKRIWNSLGFQFAAFFHSSDPELFRIVAESHKLANLIRVCLHKTLINIPPKLTSWHPCRTNFMVLNVDGSYLGSPGRADFGGLIRKGSGECIIGFSGFLGIANVILAELMALYHGLKIARTSGYNHRLCYPDSQTVLDLVLKRYNSYHCYAAVIANIQDLLKLHWEVSFYHTLREGNACADFFAKLGSTNDSKLTMWEALPNDLKDLLLFDALWVAYPRA